MGQLRSTITQTRMIMYSTALYARLGEQTGRDPGWRGVGGLRLATTPERQAELERASRARPPRTGWSWSCCRLRRHSSGWGC